MGEETDPPPRPNSVHPAAESEDRNRLGIENAALAVVAGRERTRQPDYRIPI